MINSNTITPLDLVIQVNDIDDKILLFDNPDNTISVVYNDIEVFRTHGGCDYILRKIKSIYGTDIWTKIVENGNI